MFIKNLLIQGDNLKGLHYLLKNGYTDTVDLCYIDPPYNTGNTFYMGGTITKDYSKPVAYVDKFDSLDDYLNFLKERLVCIRELLKPTGSFYLHTDYKYGHYLKVLCDKVFGIENYKSSISRIKCNPKNMNNKNYGNIKDMILFYTMSDEYTWNQQYLPYDKEDLNDLFHLKDDKGYFYTSPLHSPCRSNNKEWEWDGLMPPPNHHWRYTIEKLDKFKEDGLIYYSKNGNPRLKKYVQDSKGKKVQDVITFKDNLKQTDMKYPTEKNKDLLDLIIKTSSNPNDVVLDCFMGSGTTLETAYENNRIWCGMDNSEYAINLFEKNYANLPCKLTYDKSYEKVVIG